MPTSRLPDCGAGVSPAASSALVLGGASVGFGSFTMSLPGGSFSGAIASSGSDTLEFDFEIELNYDTASEEWTESGTGSTTVGGSTNYLFQGNGEFAMSGDGWSLSGAILLGEILHAEKLTTRRRTAGVSRRQAGGSPWVTLPKSSPRPGEPRA